MRTFDPVPTTPELQAERAYARFMADLEMQELEASVLADAPTVPPLQCILCESGYHDHAWEITHVMKCGCPCHEKRVNNTVLDA